MAIKLTAIHVDRPRDTNSVWGPEYTPTMVTRVHLQAAGDGSQHKLESDFLTGSSAKAEQLAKEMVSGWGWIIPDDL